MLLILVSLCLELLVRFLCMAETETDSFSGIGPHHKGRTRHDMDCLKRKSVGNFVFSLIVTLKRGGT